jgi:cobalt-zinc-cadmium efflux system protein
MGSGHQHNDIKSKRLLWATLLNFGIATIEIIGGILSNSLALISDALHNIGDAIAVLLAYIAHLIGKRPSNERKTFGYKRIEILAAFLNALILIAVTVYLFYEAVIRFLEPEPVQGRLMLIVAVFGLVANLLAVLLLHRDSSKNINVKAAYLHLIADTLSSVAVIAGAILIYYFEIYWIDPVITVVIGVYLIKETWAILKQTVDILMQSTPQGINLIEISKEIEAIPSVANVHHVHAWNLDDHSVHFECHVDLSDNYRISEAEKVYHDIESILEEKYHISHITIQFEHKWCEDKNMIHQ